MFLFFDVLTLKLGISIIDLPTDKPDIIVLTARKQKIKLLLTHAVLKLVKRWFQTKHSAKILHEHYVT